MRPVFSIFIALSLLTYGLASWQIVPCVGQGCESGSRLECAAKDECPVVLSPAGDSRTVISSLRVAAARINNFKSFYFLRQKFLYLKIKVQQHEK